MSPGNPTLLFVYGTLKRGGTNHRFLSNQTFRGAAHTLPGFRLYDMGDYPGMVPVPGDIEGVLGEVWAVDANCLAELDRFEGTAEGLYRREPVPLRPPFTDQKVDAYIYEQNIGDAPEIGSKWDR